MSQSKGNSEKVWLGLSLGITILLTVVFLGFVDMRPRISPDFFFGSDDPDMADTRKINALFPAEEFMIISVDGKDIYSKAYARDLGNLTDRLQNLGGFTKIIAITEGPASAMAARASPFWRPLLINSDESATLVLAFLPRQAPPSLVPASEQIVSDFANKGSLGNIHMSGMPFIAEQIGQSIIRDAKFFSLAALLLFAGLLWGIYKSPVIAFGASISGISAIFLSLSILSFSDQPVGILTANLAIIVFVLVQSQVIYLTNNWLRSPDRGGAAVISAIRKTVVPSLWCAVTTLLGFITLLFVSAEPLRQLGAGGIIGVLVAFCACYLLFPPFLMFAKARAASDKGTQKQSVPKNGSRLLQYLGAVFIVVAVVLSIPGLFRLNTDPGLLSYFERGGDIERGLANIDKNGGSSPLQIVVSLKSGKALDNADAYARLWRLHQKLATYKPVGTVLSLPALLAEANNYPLAFLLPWREIISLLRLEANQGVVDNFLSDDREKALFLLRMKEAGRETPRADVIKDIRALASAEGFSVDLVGGVYALQGRLSELVKSSVATGLISLLGIFFGIAWIVTRNIRFSLAMFVSAATIPLISLGGAGLLAVPLDVISAPAISVAFGLAVDAIIHLALAVRRKSRTLSVAESWRQALAEQGNGIIFANGIICIGFLIFSFSEFPPTVRFGGMIVVGAALAAFCALSFFPVLARLIAGSGLTRDE